MIDLLHYSFVQHALLAGTILSVASAPVGQYALVRHQVFASEALSDVAFTGAVVGALIGVNPFVGLVCFTVAAGLTIASFGHRLAERDIAVGTVLAWVLGLGALALSLFNSNLSGTGTGFSGVTVLFGSILAVSAGQLLGMIVTSVAVLAVLAVVGRPLLFASLDPNVAVARGVPVRILGLVFMTLVAAVMAEAVQVVGAMLAFALLLLPAAAAQRMTTNLAMGTVLAVVLAVTSTWVGILAGSASGLPAGACIALVAFVLYASIGIVTAVRPART